MGLCVGTECFMWIALDVNSLIRITKYFQRVIFKITNEVMKTLDILEDLDGLVLIGVSGQRHKM